MKKFKYSKPYWSDELTSLWKELNKHEHNFLKYKGNNINQKKDFHTKYKIAQKCFDKTLQNAARNY